MEKMFLRQNLEYMNGWSCPLAYPMPLTPLCESYMMS